MKVAGSDNEDLMVSPFDSPVRDKGWVNCPGSDRMNPDPVCSTSKEDEPSRNSGKENERSNEIGLQEHI